MDQSLPYIDANKLGQSRVGSIQKVNEASQLSRSNVRSQKGVEYSRKLNFWFFIFLFSYRNDVFNKFKKLYNSKNKNSILSQMMIIHKTIFFKLKND